VDLQGRHVVITGASQGIGEHIAERFSERGAQVLLVARSADKLARIAQRVGGSWIAADLSQAPDVDTLVERCIDALGHIDVWVNNAGVETDDAFVHCDRAALRNLARVNFEATLLLTRDVLPHMLRRGTGHVVQLSSIAGAIPFPGLAAYAGSKAGITQFTETLRMELKPTKIGLTVVAPGPVATPMWGRVDSGQTWGTPALTRLKHLVFLPTTDPADVAVAIVKAVENGKRYVRPMKRYQCFHVLNNAPRRLVEMAMLGVRMPPLLVDKPADSGSGDGSRTVSA
jgi:uncharacterized protein